MKSYNLSGEKKTTKRQLWSLLDIFGPQTTKTTTTTTTHKKYPNDNTTTTTINTNTNNIPLNYKDSLRLAKDKQYTDILASNTKNTTKRTTSKTTTTSHTTSTTSSTTSKTPLDASKVEFHDLVCAHYSPSHVVYIDGSEHFISKRLLERNSPCVGHFFSREGYNEVV